MRLLPFNNRMPLWLKIVDAMADNGPIAPKKPADLRYVTLPSWTQPVSLYLLERIEGDKVWLICRPALDSAQESEPQFQLPDEEECICFERVDFSTLNSGDEFPLGQPGVMVGAIMFDFLIYEELSPYTIQNMLGLCPAELRKKPRHFSVSPGGGSVGMGSSGGDTDATAKILEAIQGVKDDVKGMEKRVAKLEAPAAKPKATPGRTVFFGEDDTDEEEEPEPPLPIPPVKAGRKAEPREVEIKEPAGGKVIVYVDAEDAAVGGGGRGLAGLEKARKNAAASPMRRWENVLAKCKEITDLEGCGGVLTYFKLHTHVKHHRLALKYLHSILNIAKSTKEPAVLGHCANALVFIDQMVHNEGMQEVAETVALFPEPQIKFVPQGSAILPTPEKPYGELVEPDVLSTATRASEDIEKLQAKVAKVNKAAAAAKATPR